MHHSKYGCVDLIDEDFDRLQQPVDRRLELERMLPHEAFVAARQIREEREWA